MKITGYCYHSANVITLRYHIKPILQYYGYREISAFLDALLFKVFTVTRQNIIERKKMCEKNFFLLTVFSFCFESLSRRM